MNNITATTEETVSVIQISELKLQASTWNCINNCLGVTQIMTDPLSKNTVGINRCNKANVHRVNHPQMERHF
jgi:hypothetical protein